MKQFYSLLFAFVLLSASSGFAQAPDCTGGRYTQSLFSVTTTSNVQYGSNYNPISAANENLFVDIYEPTGDTASLRPLIIWAHGGSFVGGSRTDGDVVNLSTDFAEMGYVCASMSYRLGMNGLPFPGPTAKDAKESVVRAVQDAKAAVRFFYKDIATTNTYRIDPNRIYLGGSSAGAFISLHYAYLDDISELPNDIDTTLQGMGGGLEGNSGNAGYASDIHAVISLAGALADTSWMQPGDQPLISIHAENDGTVPFGSATLTLLGLFPIIDVDGSESVHAKADEIGLVHCFKPWWGGSSHPAHTNAAWYDTTFNYVRDFMVGIACGTPPQCGNILAAADEPVPSGEFQIFPNPAVSEFTLRLSDQLRQDTEVSIFDLSGKVLKTIDLNAGEKELRINREGLSTGLYFVKVQNEKMSTVKKLILE